MHIIFYLCKLFIKQVVRVSSSSVETDFNLVNYFLKTVKLYFPHVIDFSFMQRYLRYLLNKAIVYMLLQIIYEHILKCNVLSYSQLRGRGVLRFPSCCPKILFVFLSAYVLDSFLCVYQVFSVFID